MAAPTGKLAFAYRTIASLEQQLADVRAQLPSLAGEAVEVVAWRVSHPDTVWKVYEKNPESWAAGDFEIQTLMTVAQHQRILAASVGTAEPAGLLHISHFRDNPAMENVDFQLIADLKPGSYKLYTHPVDQVAEGVAVPVQLLKIIEQSWRIPSGCPKSVSEEAGEIISNGLAELRALLAKREGVKM